MKQIKNLLRTAAVLCAAGALLLSSAGCRSMIELARMDEAARKTATTLDLAQLVSQKEGYHFPGFSWGGGFGDFQRSLNYPVTEFEGYTDREEVYTADYLRKIVFGRENISASIGLMDDVVTFVSLRFDNTDAADPLDQYDARLFAELVRLFGQPAETVTSNETVNDMTYQMKTTVWEMEVNGRLTSLQWGTATLPATTVPAFASLGVSWTSTTEENGEAK